MHEDEAPMWADDAAWLQAARQEGGTNLAVDVATSLMGMSSDTALSYFTSDLPSAYRARWLASHKPKSLEVEFAKISDAIREEIIGAQDPDRRVRVTVRLSQGEQDFVEQMLRQDGYMVEWEAAPAALDVTTSGHCVDHVVIVWAPAPAPPDGINNK